VFLQKTRIGAALLTFQNLLHRTSVNISRRIGRPTLGRFIDETAYGTIRQAFEPAPITAADLTLDTFDVPMASDLLRRHGIVVLRNFIAPALADAARREAEAVATRIAEASNSSAVHGEVDGMPWQVGGSLFHDHTAMLEQKQSIANMRSRDRTTPNGGVIDIFFIAEAARIKGWLALDSCCTSMQKITTLVAAVSDARPAQINLLHNSSVTHTRGLHVDNLDGSYKAFLYLGDVHPEDGPYAYVPGSPQRADLLRREARLNSLLGHAETDSHAFEDLALSFPVPKGTLIVSCQSGVHRGLPQKPGASRSVLVANFR
jgi:hypothetical protein